MILTPQHSFSPSQISTHENCPSNWRYSRMRLPRIYTETIYATAGSVFHSSIAQYYKVIDPKPSRGQIEGTIQTIVDREWKAAGLEKMKSRKEKCLKNFVKFEKKRLREWKQYKPTLTENRLRARVGGNNFNTIVDAYWEADATIVDWKTGSLNSIGVSEMIQGQVMKMVILGLGKPVERVIFVALRIGLELVMPKVTEGFIEGKIQSIREHDRLNFFPKKKSRLCSWCSYQLRCEMEGRCLWM